MLLLLIGATVVTIRCKCSRRGGSAMPRSTSRDAPSSRRASRTRSCPRSATTDRSRSGSSWRRGSTSSSGIIGDDPRFVIGMLVNISGRYMDLDDTDGELAALVKAEQIARKLGDPDLIAFVQCNTVETELAAGRPQQAAERCATGSRISRRCRILRRSACASAGSPRRVCAGPRATSRTGLRRRPGSRMAWKRAVRRARSGYVTVTSTLELMLGRCGTTSGRARLEPSREHCERAGRPRRDDVAIPGASQRSESSIRAGRSRALRSRFSVRSCSGSPLSKATTACRRPLLLRLGLYEVRVEETPAGLELLDRGVATTAVQNNRSHVRALLDRASANLWLDRLDPASSDLTEAERLLAQNPIDVHDYVRAARLLRAQWHFARDEPAAALTQIDDLLEDVGYPGTRVANRLPSMLTLKARAELALGRTAAALRTSNSAVEIAAAMSLEAQSQCVRRRRADGARGDTARARRFRERRRRRSARCGNAYGRVGP